jgi:hypothetical protein
MILTLSTQRGYLQAISGMFATKQHPGGLTPKEIDILVTILFVLDQESVGANIVTRLIKRQVSQLSNHPTQVVTNYMKRLRDKGALDKDNRLHKLIRTNEVTIKYKEPSKDNV